MGNEHMYGRCEKCGLTYDMDFEESPYDQHGECYSEDWDVWVADCPMNCDVHTPRVHKPFTLDLSDKRK